MPATRGTPLEGDRGAFDTVAHAAKHALDIKNAALLRHTPLPGVDGNYIRDDGTNWVTHVGLPLTDLNDYSRGVIIRGGAVGYEAYSAKTDRHVLIGDGTDVISRALVAADIPAEYVRLDGTLGLTAPWDAGAHKITAEQLESDIAIGTAPLIVASTTVVANLNADLLDGQHGAYYAPATAIAGTAGRVAQFAAGGAAVEDANLVAPANLLTLVAAAPYTLTVPATGTVGLLGMAQTWTAVNTFDENILQADAKRIVTDEIRARDTDGLKLYSADGKGLFIADGGNVGRGTLTPGQAFVVGDDIGYLITSVGVIALGDSTAGKTPGIVVGQDGNNRAWLLWDNNNKYLYLGTRNAGVFYNNTLILKDGKVGVGTTTMHAVTEIKAGSSASYPTSGTLGVVPAGTALGITGDNGFYGLYAGVKNDGNSWIQSQRNDGANTAYNIILQPGGGNVVVGGIVDTAQLTAKQPSLAGAQPVLYLDQRDVSEEAIVVSYGAADVDMRLLRANVTGSPEFGWDEGEDRFTLSHGLRVGSVIRGTSSLWWYCKYIDAFSVSPGASGAALIPPDPNTLGGYQLDAATEYLYFNGRVCSNWDGATDLIVTVTWEVNVNNSAGNVADTVDLRLLAFYKGDGETGNKWQFVEVATIVGQSARYKQFTTTFAIDYDLAGNIVEVGDTFSFRINLETDTSEVDDVIINFGTFSYRTAKMNVET